MNDTPVIVRYMVSDVKDSVDWYVSHLGFTQLPNASPSFAAVERGPLRLLLSGRAAPPVGPCRTGASLSPAAGTASSSCSRISPPKSNAGAPRA